MSYVENILAVLNAATDEEKQHGLTWYAQAKASAQAIADANELPIHIVVGVVAALSPTNNWDQNLKDAALFCETFVNGGYFEDVKASTYKKMWEKAWTILAAGADHHSPDYIAQILNGPKITDFYWCIMGGTGRCVIDGHAWCIANADRRTMQEVPNIGKKLRQELQNAYAEAGDYVGMRAYEVQAATWVAWRRIHGVV